MQTIDWQCPTGAEVARAQDLIQSRHGVIFDTEIGHTIKVDGKPLAAMLGESL